MLIRKKFFTAMHFDSSGLARALEKLGKLRILKEKNISDRKVVPRRLNMTSGSYIGAY